MSNINTNGGCPTFDILSMKDMIRVLCCILYVAVDKQEKTDGTAHSYAHQCPVHPNPG